MSQLKPTKGVPYWVYLNVALLAGLSIFSLTFRYRVEDSHRQVAIAAEGDVIENLAAAQNIPFQQALTELHGDGLTAVVLSEQYANELFSDGELQLLPGGNIEGSAGAIARLQRGVHNRFPGFGAFVANNSATSETAVQYPNVNLVRTVSVGLNPEQTSAAQGAGIEIVARLTNPPSASDVTVTQTLAWAKELGAKIILPEGAQVLGRRDALDAFTDGLKSYDLYYASPEFGKIGGDEEVVQKAPESVVRLHSAQTEELDKMRPVDAIDRYVKAARERNQRVLLLRPLSSAAAQPLSDFGGFIDQVKVELEKEQGIIGQPSPFPEPGVPQFIFPLIGLALVPLAIWTASCFFNRRWVLIAGGIGCLVLAAACVKPLGRSLDAIVAAITLPIAAFMILDRRDAKHWWIEYIVITLISLTGGLAIAGLLNALPYYIQAKQFLGVKFAHFFPILVVGWYFFHRFRLVKKSLNSPVEWGKGLLALIVLGALLFMLERTGNDNPATVSDLELKMRAVLDAVLFVRPRTKEFLIGHPFLIIGIGMLIRAKRDDLDLGKWAGWLTLFLMLGAIGQTSIVNTMCHIHTPLMISLPRIGVGLVVGGILGLASWGVIGMVSRKIRPAEG